MTLLASSTETIISVIVFVLSWLVSTAIERSKKRAPGVETPPVSAVEAERLRATALVSGFDARMERWRQSPAWTRGLGVTAELVRPRLVALQSSLASLPPGAAVDTIANDRAALESLLFRLDGLAAGLDEQIGLFVVGAFPDLRAELQLACEAEPLPPDEAVPARSLLLNWAGYFAGDCYAAAMDSALALRIQASLDRIDSTAVPRFPQPPPALRAAVLGAALNERPRPAPEQYETVLPNEVRVALPGPATMQAALRLGRRIAETRFMSLGARTIAELAAAPIAPPLAAAPVPEPIGDGATQEAPAAEQASAPPVVDAPAARSEFVPAPRPSARPTDSGSSALPARVAVAPQSPRRRLRDAMRLSEALRL